MSLITGSHVRQCTPSGVPAGDVVTLRRSAKDRASVLAWNIHLALMFVTVLFAVVFLRSLDISIFLVGGLAAFGLLALAVVGRWRWKKLEKKVIEVEIEFQGWLTEETAPVPAREAGASATEILSKRELEILDKVACGMSNLQISVALGISAQTVKHHMSHVLAKLEVDSRTAAVLVAMSRGWISPTQGMALSAGGAKRWS